MPVALIKLSLSLFLSLFLSLSLSLSLSFSLSLSQSLSLLLSLPSSLSSSLSSPLFLSSLFPLSLSLSLAFSLSLWIEESHGSVVTVHLAMFPFSPLTRSVIAIAHSPCLLLHNQHHDPAKASPPLCDHLKLQDAMPFVGPGQHERECDHSKAQHKHYHVDYLLDLKHEVQNTNTVPS